MEDFDRPVPDDVYAGENEPDEDEYDAAEARPPSTIFDLPIAAWAIAGDEAEHERFTPERNAFLDSSWMS